MSNIHNEVIKERIMEEIESMTINDFQSLLDKHNYSGLNDHIDVGIKDMIEILFEERCE
jgi:hypothetical protein|tara:strand:- start:3 stop:179 length:177 start_codon:yes stop_codon:yes gene_type:complete